MEADNDVEKDTSEYNVEVSSDSNEEEEYESLCSSDFE